MTLVHWKTRVLNGTHGTHSGVILRYILGHSDDELPRVHGHASVTSDGFIIADYVDRDGNYRMGAFIGDVANLTHMHANVTKHFKLTVQQSVALGDAIDNWAGTSWRS